MPRFVLAKYKRSSILSVHVAETLNITDVPVATVTNTSISESVVTSDVYSNRSIKTAAVAETVGVTDTVSAALLNILDAPRLEVQPIVDTVSSSKVTNPSRPESMLITDTVTAVVVPRPNLIIADTPQIRDTITTSKINRPSRLETVAISDSFTSSLIPGNPNPSSRSNLMFESKYELVTNWLTNTLPTEIGGPWLNQQHCCNHSIFQAPTQRYGTKAVGFLLNRNDPQVSNNWRCEMTLGGDDGGQPGDINPTNYVRWYGASFYLADGYLPDPQPEAIWQWHQNSSNGSPPFAIWLREGYLEVLTTRSTTIDGGWEVRPPYDSRWPRLKTNFNQLGSDAGILAPIGQWFDLVINIRWSTTGNGYINIWFNGTLVFRRAVGELNGIPGSGHGNIPTTPFNGITNYIDANGNYMKIGVYKWTFANALDQITSRRMYVDEVRVGNGLATYNDVAPGNY